MFRQFTQYMTRNWAVQAWAWSPVVPASERELFEQTAQAAGMAGFEIWQTDAAGERVPATKREVYYPVFRALAGGAEGGGAPHPGHSRSGCRTVSPS